MAFSLRRRTILPLPTLRPTSTPSARLGCLLAPAACTAPRAAAQCCLRVVAAGSQAAGVTTKAGAWAASEAEARYIEQLVDADEQWDKLMAEGAEWLNKPVQPPGLGRTGEGAARAGGRGGWGDWAARAGQQAVGGGVRGSCRKLIGGKLRTDVEQRTATWGLRPAGVQRSSGLVMASAWSASAVTTRLVTRTAGLLV
jgi:hypothetical protein